MENEESDGMNMVLVLAAAIGLLALIGFGAFFFMGMSYEAPATSSSAPSIAVPVHTAPTMTAPAETTVKKAPVSPPATPRKDGAPPAK